MPARNKPQFKKYKKLLTLLKKHAPAAYPVSVRRKKLHKQLDGVCWKDGKKFYIHICASIDEPRAMDVLLHEWAHAIAWNNMLDAVKTDEEFHRLSHGPEWGVAYSKVYGVYENLFLPAVS